MSKNNIPHQDNNPENRSNPDHPQLTSNSTDQGLPDVVKTSSAAVPNHSESDGQALVTSNSLPSSILSNLFVFLGSNGNAYLLIADKKNVYLLRIGTKPANNFLRRLAHKAGVRLKTRDLKDLNDDLTAHAELSGDTRDVWYRVALVKDGFELDVGNDSHTRIRIRCGKVEIIPEGSDTLFYRTPGMQPFVLPADDGDLKLLNKYVNLDPASVALLIAWLSYTLAHPKVSTTNFVILVLRGDQGSGKSLLCKIIQALVDPSVVGVQTFPRNHKDLVIAAQHAHVLFFDNLRILKQLMSDTLCTASTGGATTTRQLYTDDDQHVHWLHVALVLNGIHDFIDQPDLAQRCLPLHLRPMDEKARRSESEIIREFQAELPVIFRGLLDLIASVMTHLPSVEVTHPERMIDFVHWLAAMEKVDGVPTGAYQAQYSAALNEGMLDSLMENPLAAAVMSFVDDKVDDFWTGTPTGLLQELDFRAGKRAPYSRDWPQNPIALSKRLRSLQAGLRRQGIEVELSRGKTRKITIERIEGAYND